MKKLVLALSLLVAPLTLAKPAGPEEYLKGKIIISDKPLPSRWNSVGGFVSQMKSMNKGSLWYDKKSGKLTVHYNAFFAKPVDDVQVMLVLYDVTGGAHEQKVSTENFMTRGDRVLFNSVVFDKEDIEGNRKYLMTIEDRRRVIASGTFILRTEGPHYSGKVTFSDDDAKKEKEGE